MKIPHQFKKIITVVTRTVPTERIVLLGYLDRNGKAFSVFNNHPIPSWPVKEANILVITTDVHSRSPLIDMIEQRCKAIIPVTCTLLSLHEWMKLAQHGCGFVKTIQQGDCSIYQCRNTTRIDFAEEKAAEYIENQNKEIGIWYNNGVSFLKMACTQHMVGNYRTLAFCLHQAAEQLLIMMIQASTGIRTGTHNFTRLLRFMRFYDQDLHNVFMAISEEEQKSICLLRDTYIHSRYKAEFEISDAQIQYLMGELGKLQSIARKILNSYRYRINAYSPTAIVNELPKE